MRQWCGNRSIRLVLIGTSKQKYLMFRSQLLRQVLSSQRWCAMFSTQPHLLHRDMSLPQLISYLSTWRFAALQSRCCLQVRSFSKSTRKPKTFSGYSGECPPAPPVPDGQECIEEGECANGICLPFCQKKSIGKKSCICEDCECNHCYYPNVDVLSEPLLPSMLSWPERHLFSSPWSHLS